MSKEFITFMRNRVSESTLDSPAPNVDEWECVLEAASRAADHGGLRPWRYRIYEGEGRAKLGEVYWQHALSEVDTISMEKKASFIKKAYRAPAIILVYASLQDHPKVPKLEQIMAVSASAQQILLGVNALGYGAIWRTGPACFTDKTKELLSLKSEDQIVGLIYVGTPTKKTSDVVKQTKLNDHLQWVRD